MPETIHIRAVTAAIIDAGLNYEEAQALMRKTYMIEVLRRNRGNQCKTAALIGVHRNTIGRHLEELGIDAGALRPRTWIQRNKDRQKGRTQ